MESLRSPRLLADVARMKRPNDHAEQTSPAHIDEGSSLLQF